MYGIITIQNIEEVANAILQLLDGKKYTFVAVYEYKRYEPETRTNQKLKYGNNGSPLSIWYGDGGDYAGFHFCDSYGVWGCSTGEYINIEERQYGQITIHKTTGEGKDCYWQITVQ